MPLPRVSDKTARIRFLRVLHIAGLSRGALRRMSRAEFRKHWSAVCFCFVGLHPDGALDHGKRIRIDRESTCPVPELLDVVARHYERSGWPVALAHVAKEGWRRFRAGALSDGQFYDSESQFKGFVWSRPGFMQAA